MATDTPLNASAGHAFPPRPSAPEVRSSLPPEAAERLRIVHDHLRNLGIDVSPSRERTFGLGGQGFDGGISVDEEGLLRAAVEITGPEGEKALAAIKAALSPILTFSNEHTEGSFRSATINLIDPKKPN